MIQRCLVIFTRDFSEVFSGTVDNHILWALILSSAIGSPAILPDMARCACSHDAQDAHGPRQSGSAKFLPCPDANRSPSRLMRASPAPTALPKWGDGLHCAAGA